MALNILDQLIGATGFSTKVSDDAAREARDNTIGMSGRPELGGLIPGMEAEIGYRQEFLDRYDAERGRVLGQFDENRAARGQINEAALAQLPALTAAATPEGYVERIDMLSADPGMQRVLERQRQQRRREVTNQLAAGGLTRSGAAAEAAADATLTNEEFAFQTEQNLFNRALGISQMYQDLPIANMMIPETLQRDLSIADNLVQQGLTRGQADLLMGQISAEASEAMLENLLRVYGAAQTGAGPPINIINDVTTSVVSSIGEMIEQGGGWLYDSVSNILGDILGDFNQGGPSDPAPGDINIPGVDVPPVTTPEIPPVPGGQQGTPIVPDRPATPPGGDPAGPITEPIPGVDLPEGVTQEQWNEWRDMAPPGTADPDAWVAQVLETLGGLAAARQNQDPQAPDVGVADPDQPPFELPGIGTLPPNPDLNVPDIDPEFGLGDIFSSIETGGNALTSGGVQGPTAGGGGYQFSLPNLASNIINQFAGEWGRDVGEGLFDRKAQSNAGATIGTTIGSAWGPVGAAVGAVLGGIVDSAFGTSDQKNVTLGFATTPPGDDQAGEYMMPSGLKLYGIARRVDDIYAKEYVDTIQNVDQYLTDVAEAAGFDVNLRNDGFGGEVQGKGKDLRKNPTFFGSATEGSEKSTKERIGQNMGQGINSYVDAWIRAALDQGQISGDVAQQLRDLTGKDGRAQDMLQSYQDILFGNAPDVDVGPNLPTGGIIPGLPAINFGGVY